MTLSRLFALTAACAAIAVSPASARGRFHHRARHGEARSAASRRHGYASPYGRHGGAVARAAARAQKEPGVTEELAPDAKQTATGGPVGGVPGFSGGM